MVRWGILGAGNIAHRFAASLRRQPDSVLAAISCRSAAKAAAFTAQYPAKAVYLDHAALLADADVDAIYLALPHGLHCAWAVRALAAGKAVLCEKPAVLNEAEMQAIADAARQSGCLFMEAMKTRFVPLYPQLRALLDAGTIGGLQRIETCFYSFADLANERDSYLTQSGQGGGLLDNGCYCASWLEDFLPGAPELTDLQVKFFGAVDCHVEAELRFGSATARLVSTLDGKGPRRAVLYGTAGRIEVEDLHRPQALTVHADGQLPRTVEAPYVVDDFYGQIEHFVHCLQNGMHESPVMPLAASLRCARILDTVRAGF